MSTHNLTVPLLVGNGVPVSEIASNVQGAPVKAVVEIAPAYQFQREDGALNWPVVRTYTTDTASIAITGLEDADTNGDDVIWQMRIKFLDRSNGYVGGESVLFKFADGAPTDAAYPDDVTPQDVVVPPEYGPTWAVQAEQNAAAAAASAAAAETSAAAVQAVVATNDGIMTAVAEDPDSDFAGALSATIGTAVATATANLPTDAEVDDKIATAIGTASPELSAGVLSASERTWLGDYETQKRDSPLVIPAHTPLTRAPQLASVTFGTSSAITGKTRYSWQRVVTGTSANGSPTLTAAAGTFTADDVGKQVSAVSGAMPATLTTITAVSGDGTTATMSQNALGATTQFWIGRDGGTFTTLGQSLIPKPTGGLQGTSVVRQSSSSNGAGWLFNAFAVEGIHIGRILHVYGPGATGQQGYLTVYVDEGFGWESVTDATITLPQTTTIDVSIDFGSSRERKVKLEFTNWFGWQGVYTEPGDTWSSAGARTDATVVIEGDSYIEGNLGGTTAEHDAWRSWAAVGAKLLGFRRPTLIGQSGTGWLNDGKAARTSNEKMRERVPDLIARNPDVWIIGLGENDESYTLAALTTEATAVLALIKTGLPRARGYVIGPWGKADDSLDGFLSSKVTVAVKSACQSNGIPFIDPIGGKVYNAAGVQIASTGRWLSDADFTPDGIHPLAATSLKLAYKVAAAIARIEQQRRYPSA